MDGNSAVIFIPDDTAKTGLARPLMLSRIMGVPLLRWLSGALYRGGVSRCFLVCHDRYLSEARACFPEEVALTACKDQDAADLMHVFLSTAREEERQVLVITGPCVHIAPEAVYDDDGEPPAPASACRVDRQALMDALDDSAFSFGRFLVSCGEACTDRDGMFSISGPEELADWQPLLKRSVLYELARQGVEIWDYDSCYVDPAAQVGAGTVLMPGSILRGPCRVGADCVIGPNTLLQNAAVGNGSQINCSQIYDSTVGQDASVGPYAYIRPDCAIGSRTRIGSCVEVKNSSVGEGTQAAHLSYIGDADAGRNCNFGAASVTVNFDRRAKHRTRVEDEAFIGCGVNLIAPVHVGRGAYVAAGSTITEDVPAQALGIARTRQQNKKDWAIKNK